MNNSHKCLFKNRKSGIITFHILLLLVPFLFLGSTPENRIDNKSHHGGITVKELDKFIGTYGFMENDIYWKSWKGYRKWLELLHDNHIHYAKFWLTAWNGNISWLYAWKIENGNASTPVNQRIYDLYSYNKDYFKELKQFVDYAYKLKIVVNLNVFDDCHLRHARNNDCNPEYHNIQGISNRNDWYSSEPARDIAKKFWNKVYKTLQGYPNVIYTVCNENYDFPGWQADIAGHMSKSEVYLDTGDSKITPESKDLYSFVSLHWQYIPENIAKYKKQDNLIFSSDGASYNDKTDPAQLNKCVRAGAQQGKGYEFYVGTAMGWKIEDITTRIGEESLKILDF